MSIVLDRIIKNHRIIQFAASSWFFLWTPFTPNLQRGIQAIKLLKCPPNNNYYYTPRKHKISNLWITLDTNANSCVTNRHLRHLSAFSMYLFSSNSGHRWTHLLTIELLALTLLNIWAAGNFNESVKRLSRPRCGIPNTNSWISPLKK